MLSAQGVLRHSMMMSCLAVAACSGGGMSSKVAAPQAYGGGGAPYQAEQPSHAAMSPGGSIAEAQTAPDRPGLGTTFGESGYAPISFAPVIRSAGSPRAGRL